MHPATTATEPEVLVWLRSPGGFDQERADDALSRALRHPAVVAVLRANGFDAAEVVRE